MATDFGSLDSILAGFNKLLKLQTVGTPTTIPSPLILIGTKRRSGMSPTAIASRIISRKSEAGLPVGTLPSGGVAPDEIMERIRVEEIIRSIQEESVVTVVIPPGTSLTAAGASAAGPVTVVGSTITLSTGYGVIQ